MKKFLILVFLLIPVIASAETITLKSGRVIEGEIIEQTEEYTKINFKGVDLTFYADEIEMGVSDVMNQQNEFVDDKKDFNQEEMLEEGEGNLIVEDNYADEFKTVSFGSFTIQIPNYLIESKGEEDFIVFFYNIDNYPQRILNMSTRDPFGGMRLSNKTIYEMIEVLHNPGWNPESVAFSHTVKKGWDKIENMDKFETEQFIVFFIRGLKSKSRDNSSELIPAVDYEIFLRQDKKHIVSITYVGLDGHILEDDEAAYMIDSIVFDN